RLRYFATHVLVLLRPPANAPAMSCGEAASPSRRPVEPSCGLKMAHAAASISRLLGELWKVQCQWPAEETAHHVCLREHGVSLHARTLRLASMGTCLLGH